MSKIYFENLTQMVFHQPRSVSFEPLARDNKFQAVLQNVYRINDFCNFKDEIIFNPLAFVVDTTYESDDVQSSF